MDDGLLIPKTTEDVYTLLGVRGDGVVSMVDLLPAAEAPSARARALALLREHGSCHTVEVWRDGALVDQVARS
jgi:hypothetical protein